MAQRKIVWSLQARNNRIQILEFWIEHNHSKEYSTKLNNLFKEAAEFIAIGKLTEDKLARIKIVRDY